MESPRARYPRMLRAEGAYVRRHAPHVPSIRHNGHPMPSELDPDAALAAADCVVGVTDHSSYAWAAIRPKARLVLDTRNAMCRRPGRISAKPGACWTGGRRLSFRRARPHWWDGMRKTGCGPGTSRRRAHEVGSVRVTVTGGAGFIGSNGVEWLLAEDDPRRRFLTPLGLFDFVALERAAFCALSDSGTVQEECCIFHVPNVTLRDVTERPETLECGSNMLAGCEPEALLRCVETVLAQGRSWQPRPSIWRRTCRVRW